MTILLTDKQMIRFRNTAKRTKLVFGEIPCKKRTGQASDRLNQIINR